MELIKTVKMLISRYRADAADLARREGDLTREMEIVENLISTVTIWYVSKAIQTRELSSSQMETEKAKEKLEHLKTVLGDLRQAIEVVIGEEIVIRKRIEDLEILLNNHPDEFTNATADVDRLIFKIPNYTYNNDLVVNKEVKDSVAEQRLQPEDNEKKVCEELVENVRLPKTNKSISQNIGSDEKVQGDMSTSEMRRKKPNSSDEKSSYLVKDLKTDLVKGKPIKLEEQSQVKQGVEIHGKPVNKRQDSVVQVKETRNITNISQKHKESNDHIKESDKTIKNSVPDKKEMKDSEAKHKKGQSVEFEETSKAKDDYRQGREELVDNVKVPRTNESISQNIGSDEKVEGNISISETRSKKASSDEKSSNLVKDLKTDLVKGKQIKLEELSQVKQGVEIHGKPVNERQDSVVQVKDTTNITNISQKHKESNDHIKESDKTIKNSIPDKKEIEDSEAKHKKGQSVKFEETSQAKDDCRQGREELVDRVRVLRTSHNILRNSGSDTKMNGKVINNSETRPKEPNLPDDKLSLNIINNDHKNDQVKDKKINLMKSSQGEDINRKNVVEREQGSVDQVESTRANNIPPYLKGSKGHTKAFDETTQSYIAKPKEHNLKDTSDAYLKGTTDLAIEMTQGKTVDADGNWKNISAKLLQQVSELKENLETSSLKLRQSEDYVKRLELECKKLEKELQEKIQLLKNKADALNSNDLNCKKERVLQQQDFQSGNSLWAMQEALAETKTMHRVLSISSNMVEGEGVTPAYMQLAHWRFALKLPEYQSDKELKEKLMNGIKQGNMAPYYKEVCADLGWELDTKLYEEMCVANTKRLEELEKDHENNVMDEEDQSQLCGVWQSKLDYLCSIGDSENATALANSKVDDKTVPKSHRIDAVFSLFRISFFHGCNIKGMSTAIEKATELIEGISGGDWSARNKLKAYEGVWSLAIRDFTRAAHLFVDVVPTFESYELADFGTIIRYTVLSCMIALPRCDLRKKLMLHGVMAQALHSQYQDLREYFVSLYDGRYSDFLVCLARIEVEMKRDPLLHPHYRHYVQEMRLRAYKQILQAYRSLSLDYMAQSFGVTSEFIEREVARFAAAGRLQCKIDSVAGTVITSAHLDDSVRSKEAPEASLDRNILYQTTVKRGDILLNRLKKLARVMDF